MTGLRPLAAGNWKMNGLRGSVSQLEELCRLVNAHGKTVADVMVCPPATLISLFAETVSGTQISIGAQDCHAGPSGAHTGDIAAEMLADAGAAAVIAGHSERRTGHAETDVDVKAKAAAAHRAGLTAIVCVGETEAQRKAGETLSVVGKQLSGSLPSGLTGENTVIAYEPVWAIGTGLTPSVEDIAEVHAFIRSELEKIAGEGEGAKIRILYGGSVKPDNAAELMAIENVNGALVGGASLKADDFFSIVVAFPG